MGWLATMLQTLQLDRLRGLSLQLCCRCLHGLPAVVLPSISHCLQPVFHSGAIVHSTRLELNCLASRRPPPVTHTIPPEPTNQPPPTTGVAAQLAWPMSSPTACPAAPSTPPTSGC